MRGRERGRVYGGWCGKGRKKGREGWWKEWLVAEGARERREGRGLSDTLLAVVCHELLRIHLR